MLYIVINFISNRFCFSLLVSKLPRRFLTSQICVFICWGASGVVELHVDRTQCISFYDLILLTAITTE